MKEMKENMRKVKIYQSLERERERERAYYWEK